MSEDNKKFYVENKTRRENKEFIMEVEVAVLNRVSEKSSF